MGGGDGGGVVVVVRKCEVGWSLVLCRYLL